MKAGVKHHAIGHRHSSRAHAGKPVRLVAAVFEPRHVLKSDDALGRPAAAPGLPESSELTVEPIAAGSASSAALTIR